MTHQITSFAPGRLSGVRSSKSLVRLCVCACVCAIDLPQNHMMVVAASKDKSCRTASPTKLPPSAVHVHPKISILMTAIICVHLCNVSRPSSHRSPLTPVHEWTWTTDLIGVVRTDTTNGTEEPFSLTTNKRTTADLKNCMLGHIATLPCVPAGFYCTELEL